MKIAGGQGLTRAKTAGSAVWLIAVAIIAGFIVTSDDPRDRSAENWVYLGVVAVVIAVLWWLLVARPVASLQGNTPARSASSPASFPC